MSEYSVTKRLTVIAVLAAVYYGSAQLGLSLASAHRNVSLIWPSTGVALAAVLLLGYWVWPAIALGAFLANAATGVPVFTAGGIAVGNTLEALGGAFLVRHLIGHRNPLDQARDVFRFVGAGVLLSTMASATIGAASLCLGTAASWSDYGRLWWAWWLGDAAGALVVTPAVLAWNARGKIAREPLQVAEVALLLGLLTLVSYIVFAGWIDIGVTNLPLAYLPVPFLVWAAIRFDQRTVTTAILLTAGIAIWGTAHGLGPFARGASLNESLFLLHTFVGITAVMSLVMAAVTTERNQANETQQSSQEQYKLLVEQARDIICRVDLDGYFTYINQTVTRYKGYTQEELIGQHFTKHIRPDAREAAKRYYLRQFARNTPNTYYEFPVTKKDGSEIWLGQNVQLLTENGQVVGFQAIARDITERKQAEEALRRSQQRYEELVRSIDGIVWEADAKTFKFSFVSPQAERLLGYPIERWLSEPNFWIDHVHPKDREWAMNFCVRATREKRDHEFQYRMMAADGRLVWLHDFVTVVTENNQAVKLQGLLVDITERKQAEEALKESEERYRRLVDLSPSGVFVYCEGKTVYANRAACQILGAESPEQILEQPTMHFVHPDCHAPMLESARVLFSGGEPVRRTERQYLKVDRTVIDVQLEAAPVTWNGKPAIQGIFSDITERKQGEESLRESEKRFRTIFDQAPLGMAVIDSTTGHFRRINQTYCDIVGYPHKEMVTRTFQDVTHPDDLKADLDNMKHMMEGRTHTFQMEKRYIRKDGTIVWVNLVCVPLWLDHESERRFHIAMVEDITKRKRTEEALQQSEERFRSAFGHAAVGMALVSIDGRWLQVNPALCDVVGYSESELLATTFQAITHPDDLDTDLAYVRQMLAGEIRYYQMEKRYIHKRGHSVWILLSVSLVHDVQGNPLYFIALIKDITETKRAEEALRESETFKNRILENSPDCIKVLDLEGRLLFMNKGGQELMEIRDIALLLNSRWFEFWKSEDKERARAAVEAARTGNADRFAGFCPTATGTPKWWDVRITPLLDANGAPDRLLAISRDITEGKRAEAALRSTTEFLQALIQTSPLAIIKLDPDSNVTNWNRAAEDMLGWSESEVLGKPLPYIPPGKEAEAEALWVESLKGSGVTGVEIRRAKKDGTPIDLEVWSRTFKNQQGATVSAVGILLDITERKQSEERLAKINACFLSFGASPESNISCLTQLCGELLGAACALYNYLDGPLLRSIGQWNAPPGFNPIDPAVGHICHDVIRDGGDCARTVHNLPETRYARTDPNVLPYKLKTYFGMAVKCQNTAVGSLCAVFQHDFVPSEADTKLLGIITAAIGVEEERRLTEKEQKRLVEELADSRNRFEMFFRQTPSAISITTIKNGQFIDLNKQAEVLTGYSREELIGRTTVEMNLYVDPTDRPGLVEALKQKGMLTDLEREIRTKSGEIRTAVFSLVPILMGAEPCLLSIAHDITERKRAERQLYERSRQQAIEAELSLLAVTIQDMTSLLSTATGLVSNGLDVHYCEALELLPLGTDLRLCASAGWRGDDIGQVRAMETGSLAHAALNSNKPVVRTLQNDTRFGGPQWLHDHGVVSGMSVSIPGTDGPWGVLGVYTAETRAFSKDDVNFLQTVSGILATAIERKQTENVLRNANLSLRQLSRRLLRTQEDDRRAIARDLHDEIGQSLTAIKLNVERAQRAPDRATRTRIMRDCAQITEHVLGQVRNLSLDLHPSILDDLGLAYALKWFADRQAERAGMKVEVTADPSLPRLSQDIEIVCFRIAQEALTNVVRHARANTVGITLKRGTTEVELCVQDDGTGFVVDAFSPPTAGQISIGLVSMQERAKLLGGTVKITSAPGYGTTVVATLPVVSPDGMPTEEVPRS